MNGKLACLLFFILIAVANVAFLGTLQLADAQADQATLKIQTANAAVNQAFNAVLDAEKAGANVDTLLNQLNHAATLLANAENAYRAGNFSASISNSDAALPIAKEVFLAAQNQKQATLALNETWFWFNLFSTVLFSAILVLVLLIIWRWLKRSYIKRIYESKPEVVTHEP